MTQMIFCQKLQKEAPALSRITYPGDLGRKILDNISAEAWQLWLRHQTILINEYRINPLNAQSRAFLETQMQNFLFGEGAETPEQFKPQ